jgi:hydroxymethylbilane synthase
LQRLGRGDFDAIVLAVAGLRRLGLDARVSELFEPQALLPAPGQGALAVQVRADDREVRELLRGLDHAPTRLAVVAERALLEALEGGCQVPIGALATFTGDRLKLVACVGDLDGSRLVRHELAMEVRHEEQAAELGVRVARQLSDGGAKVILARLREVVAARAAAGELWEEA